MSDLISRQAVLETLDDMDNALDEDRTVENYKELLTECYEVLPSVTPQTEKRTEERTKTHACDCINREAVLDGLASIAKAKAKSDAQKSLMGRVMFFTEQLPSVEPERKTGKWKKVLTNVGLYECSECGRRVCSPRTLLLECFPYCNCGAKMEVDG